MYIYIYISHVPFRFVSFRFEYYHIEIRFGSYRFVFCRFGSFCLNYGDDIWTLLIYAAYWAKYGFLVVVMHRGVFRFEPPG